MMANIFEKDLNANETLIVTFSFKKKCPSCRNQKNIHGSKVN
jgi:hypothetical protein